MRTILLFILIIFSFETFAQKTNNRLSLKELGDQYLNGLRKASDDSLTFLIFDSLSNPTRQSRQYSFKVANHIAKQSDGALSEAIGVYSLTYFSNYTKEFIRNISTVTTAESDSWAYYIGVELVIGARPKENQTNMQYAQVKLDKIRSSCKNLSKDDLKVLNDFIEKTLVVVKHNLD